MRRSSSYLMNLCEILNDSPPNNHSSRMLWRLRSSCRPNHCTSTCPLTSPRIQKCTTAPKIRCKERICTQMYKNVHIFVEVTKRQSSARQTRQKAAGQTNRGRKAKWRTLRQIRQRTRARKGCQSKQTTAGQSESGRGYSD